jgi:hypothetical protein
MRFIIGIIEKPVTEIGKRGFEPRSDATFRERLSLEPRQRQQVTQDRSGRKIHTASPDWRSVAVDTYGVVSTAGQRERGKIECGRERGNRVPRRAPVRAKEQTDRYK